MHARGYERAKDLGARLNWNESKISRALRNHRWQLDELDAVARALEVNASDLLRDPADYLPPRISVPTGVGKVTAGYAGRIRRDSQRLGSSSADKSRSSAAISQRHRVAR